MAPGDAMESFLDDPRAESVLSRLHALSDRQASSSLLLHNARRRLRRLIRGRSLDWDRPGTRRFLADKLFALDREKCRLCYLLCRASGARRVVEVGTSFGVSTIYLAAAVRDNWTQSGTGAPGKVVGTEIEAEKVAAARRNLDEAGLGAFADIREGDMRETLLDLGGPIDFVLLDIWAPLARPALERLAPRLRSGAIILCDNVVRHRGDYRPYLEEVRNPGRGYRSMTLPMTGGVELSVRL